MRTLRRKSIAKPAPRFRYIPLVAAIVLALTPGISAAFTVSNNGDNGGIDPAPGAGTGTLRQALVDANTVDGSNNCVYPNVTISFTGPFVIQPSTALPGLGCNPTIDGGGVVRIDGVDKSIGCGLYGASSDSTVSGLEITGFRMGLCGNLRVYANKIHGNTTGIELFSGVVGDGTSTFRNYIYSNTGAGIAIGEGSGSIYHNYIGTPDGVTAAGNGIGIDLQYTAPASVTSNVISGNTIGVKTYYSSATLEANYIGTDPAGGSPLANGVGVDIQCGAVTFLGNFISGNAAEGIKTTGRINASGNKIGTNASATGALPNGDAGVRFLSYGGCFAYGADFSDNDIAYNSGPGITLAAPTVGVNLHTNRIYANSGKNIDLDFIGGPLPNDSGDSDTGPNNRQNYPDITSVTQAGGNTMVAWTLNSQPGKAYRVEFFTNPSAGSPAGQVYQRGFGVVTDASGNITATETFTGALNNFSMTATDGSTLDTSEFSSMVSVAPTPAVTIIPDSLDFGAVAVGSTSPSQTSTVTSTGSAPYVIGTFDSNSLCYGGTICSGSDFNCSMTCSNDVSYPKDASCTVSASFSPSYFGSQSTTIYLCDNAAGSPHSITLTGNGIAPPVVLISPSQWDFGGVLVGSQSPGRSFSITNPGSGPAVIGPLSTTGPFTLVSSTCTAEIAAGSSCTAAVAFAPTQPGFATGDLVVPTPIVDRPASVPKSTMGTTTAPLYGTGVQSAELTMPSSVNVGAYTLREAPITVDVVLRNTGNAVFTFSRITATSPFTAVNNCPLNLAPGESCTVTVGFSATEPGQFNGTLAVMSNSPGTSRSVPLTALAQLVPLPAVHVAPTFIGFASRMFGTQSDTQRINVVNEGGAPASLSPLSVSVDFLIVNTTCGLTLASQATCFADVAFRPLGFGPRPGQFSFTSNSANSPHVVEMLGTGCRPFTISNRAGAASACAP